MVTFSQALVIETISQGGRVARNSAVIDRARETQFTFVYVMRYNQMFFFSEATTEPEVGHLPQRLQYSSVAICPNTLAGVARGTLPRPIILQWCGHNDFDKA